MKIIKEAGISGGDAAKLLNVSRVTVSYWINGHYKPNRFLRPSVERFLAAVEKAKDKGDLPIDKGLSEDERLRRYTKILSLEPEKSAH